MVSIFVQLRAQDFLGIGLDPETINALRLELIPKSPNVSLLPCDPVIFPLKNDKTDYLGNHPKENQSRKWKTKNRIA